MHHGAGEVRPRQKCDRIDLRCPGDLRVGWPRAERFWARMGLFRKGRKCDRLAAHPGGGLLQVDPVEDMAAQRVHDRAVDLRTHRHVDDRRQDRRPRGLLLEDDLRLLGLGKKDLGPLNQGL